MERHQMLADIEAAQFACNAACIVELLKNENMKFLSFSDINDIKCNILQRTANDQFSKDLEHLKAYKYLSKWDKLFYV